MLDAENTGVGKIVDDKSKNRYFILFYFIILFSVLLNLLRLVLGWKVLEISIKIIFFFF